MADILYHLANELQIFSTYTAVSETFCVCMKQKKYDSLCYRCLLCLQRVDQFCVLHFLLYVPLQNILALLSWCSD
jgi:hypothetical protein